MVVGGSVVISGRGNPRCRSRVGTHGCIKYLSGQRCCTVYGMGDLL